MFNNECGGGGDHILCPSPYLPPTRTEYEALLTWLDPAAHSVSTYSEPLAHADLKSVFDIRIALNKYNVPHLGGAVAAACCP